MKVLMVLVRTAESAGLGRGIVAGGLLMAGRMVFEEGGMPKDEIEEIFSDVMKVESGVLPGLPS